MKKIIQTIKLRKYKTKIVEESLKLYPSHSYLIWHKDGTAQDVDFKEDLIKALENDHIRPIRYIFDMTDRIILDRDIKVDLIKKEN